MHYDHDESSLIWYENNTPILLDIGSQYFPSCDAAFMHNRISIDGKTDQSRGTIIHRECNNKAGLVMTKTDISSLQEWPKWPIADSDWNFRYQQEPYDIPVQTWKRSIIYLMELSALVVIDEVGKDLPFEQNFIFCAKGYKKRTTDSILSANLVPMQRLGYLTVRIALYIIGDIKVWTNLLLKMHFH